MTSQISKYFYYIFVGVLLIILAWSFHTLVYDLALDVFAYFNITNEYVTKIFIIVFSIGLLYLMGVKGKKILKRVL